jgi:hypothetical protein
MPDSFPEKFVRRQRGMDMGFVFRGQGATEYLVLLAVVLIVALVSVALLGFFPGMASDARMTQSQSYWRGDARPFSITEHAITTTGSGSFVLLNMEANGPFLVTLLQVGNYSNNSSSAPISFAAGESKKVTISNMGNNSVGSIYDLNVTIAYTSPGGVDSKEYGSKNIMGKYS